MNNVVVSWSGGFDSTYMIIELLKNGNRVTAIQIVSPSLVNSQIESERTKLITPLLQKLGTFRHCVVKQDYESGDTFLLPQLPLFLFNLALSTTNEHDKVCIGYIMNDDAISFIPEIKKIWKSLGLMKKLPVLDFPLMKTKKETVISYLLYNHKEIYDLCWCCESDFSVMCGECASCKRHINSGGIIKSDDVINTEG
jgi:7-cyano-7-deazaguanine synthase in queuosine biosynthesis